MSKDLLLAKTEEEVSHAEEISIKLEDEILEFLYILIKNQKEIFPLIWHLVNNFYGDCVIPFLKLNNLVVELNFIMENHKIPVRFKTQLDTIIKICKKGILEEKNLYGAAD